VSAVEWSAARHFLEVKGH